MTPCTLWYRLHVPTQKFDFNHLEDGHCDQRVPTPKCPEHRKLWYGCYWEKVHAWLTDDWRVVYYSPEEHHS